VVKASAETGENVANMYVTRAVARVKKGGSRATRVIENGHFHGPGGYPGRDFGTRAWPGLTRIWPDFSPLGIDSEEGLVGMAFLIDPNFKNIKMFFFSGFFNGF
jgi:hypothetical protein